MTPARRRDRGSRGRDAGGGGRAASKRVAMRPAQPSGLVIQLQKLVILLVVSHMIDAVNVLREHDPQLHSRPSVIAVSYRWMASGSVPSPFMKWGSCPSSSSSV